MARKNPYGVTTNKLHKGKIDSKTCIFANTRLARILGPDVFIEARKSKVKMQVRQVTGSCKR